MDVTVWKHLLHHGHFLPRGQYTRPECRHGNRATPEKRQRRASAPITFVDRCVEDTIVRAWCNALSSRPETCHSGVDEKLTAPR
jgi:hypothetical protein